MGGWVDCTKRPWRHCGQWWRRKRRKRQGCFKGRNECVCAAFCVGVLLLPIPFAAAFCFVRKGGFLPSSLSTNAQYTSLQYQHKQRPHRFRSLYKPAQPSISTRTTIPSSSLHSLLLLLLPSSFSTASAAHAPFAQTSSNSARQSSRSCRNTGVGGWVGGWVDEVNGTQASSNPTRLSSHKAAEALGWGGVGGWVGRGSIWVGLWVGGWVLFCLPGQPLWYDSPP